MKDELPTIKRIPDDLWAEIAPLLGEEKVPGTRGRPPVPFRKVLDGILYVLRTGCQWKALPKEYGQGRRVTGGSSSGSERASSRGYGRSSSRVMTTSRGSSGCGSRSIRAP